MVNIFKKHSHSFVLKDNLINIKKKYLHAIDSYKVLAAWLKVISSDIINMRQLLKHSAWVSCIFNADLLLFADWHLQKVWRPKAGGGDMSLWGLLPYGPGTVVLVHINLIGFEIYRLSHNPTQYELSIEDRWK